MKPLVNYDCWGSPRGRFAIKYDKLTRIGPGRNWRREVKDISNKYLYQCEVIEVEERLVIKHFVLI